MMTYICIYLVSPFRFIYFVCWVAKWSLYSSRLCVHVTLVMLHLKFAGRSPRAGDKSLFLCIRGSHDILAMRPREWEADTKGYTVHTLQNGMGICIHLMDISYFGCSYILYVGICIRRCVMVLLASEKQQKSIFVADVWP